MSSSCGVQRGKAVAPSVRVPLGPEAVEEWFDLDGRLVKEAAMRKALFEVGVQPSCRRRLFKFLFGIYPTNSTTRDRKTIDIENRANYIALRRRWEVMDSTITFPEDDLVEEGPWYMELSDDEEIDTNSAPSPDDVATPSADSAVTKSGRSNGCNLTSSRDSGNFTETSLETSTEVSCGVPGVTDTCSLCGGVLQRSRGKEVAAPPETGSGRSLLSVPASNGGHCCSSRRCEQCCKEVGGSGGVALAAAASVDCGCGLGKRRRSTSGILDEEGRVLLQILEFPSKVFAARISVDLEKSYPRAKRIILRDVSRTDRSYHFFSHKRNLRKVHRILMIYSLFNPDIGYAQGMNDILARFLVITGSEVDSYCLFKRYMDKKQEDFLEHTMMSKVGLVKMLIMELDSNLFDFFGRSECQDYLFCHRWLLLDFKREFPFEESIRIFEVLSSHYLELNSDKARVETDKVIAKEFELDGGEMRAKRSTVNLGFTFDLFVCVAILTMNSDVVTQGTDAASVYGCMNGLSNNMDLKAVLSTAEELFYKYCKLTVTRGFSEILL